MTAVVHHGPPGSFKSFAIVQRVVIPALQEGRVVVTNIRGLDDIDRIAEVMEIEIPDTAELINVAHNKDGFDHMAVFFKWAPVGALIVMDECQQVYPARLKTLSCFDTSEMEQRSIIEQDLISNPELEDPRPDNVEIAFEKHRHMGWDIYLSTPHISKVNKEVRLVCQFAKRHRDLTGVLPWYKNNWREYLHDAENSGKSKSHELETPPKYKADERVFKCYSSTAIGKTKKTNEKMSVFNDYRLRIFMVVLVISLSTFIYLLFETIANFSDTPEVHTSQSLEISSDVNGYDDGSVLPSPSPQNGGSLDPQPEKFAYDLIGSSKVYFVGTFKLHHFNLISSDGVLNLTSEDFESVGYTVEKLTRCLVKLTIAGRVTVATCLPAKVDESEGNSSKLLTLN
jgi:zona occludens toxin